ncbi:helix-turn-helix transcriptional regulator [Nocardioides sp. NPDC092400]|uniref:helix-turn-helix transcriptional regulator n=1 Tax=Nocardioides sp. NPDC092400 TaxID=3155196 RepID=UPI00343AD145
MDETEGAELAQAHARTTDPAAIKAVTAHAQGWCAAVVLLARAVAATPDPAAAARRYAGVDSRVADLVASEVFSALRRRERHLLLCVGHEGQVAVSTARHLSHDPRAGEILDDLETTGLLITRIRAADALADPHSTLIAPAVPGAAGISAADNSDDPQYRIHPMLAEVIRRRMVAGGVDVSQARATVTRAVWLDIERGETRHAFDRLVTVGEFDNAARFLASHGTSMVMRGQGAAIEAFTRAHPDVVSAHPDTWFPIAVERWIADDITGARHWMDRFLAAQDHPTRPASSHPGAVESDTEGRLACIRLMRSRLGLEPISAAIGHARQVVIRSHRDSVNGEVMPQLLTELGITQNWTGDLTHAHVNLSTAVALCRTRDLPALAVSAASHLAMTEYLAGRERSAREVANQAVAMIRPTAGQTGWRPQFAHARAGIVALFATLVDLPWEAAADTPAMTRTEADDTATDQGATAAAPATPVHAADLCTRFWIRMRDARLALLNGSALRADQILQTPLELPTGLDQLPDHLQVVTLIERSFLASLSSDAETLKALEANLLALDALGEGSLVAGLRAELSGDLRRAAALFAAATGDTAYAQPASRELALVCEAQVLDALGDPEGALRRLTTATAATATRRNAVPFLGWTRHGTPIAVLLQRLAEHSASCWVHELAAAAARQPDVTTIYAPHTASPRERTTTTASRVLPTLSPRERDVLHELARGATYADIAAHLFVSENTVKTHVSSLYAKLAVSRRSEALAVARSLHLL